MKTKNVIKLLQNHGFSLDDSEILPDELDPMDTSLDVYIDTYSRHDENIVISYDEFEVLSLKYTGANGRSVLVKNEKTLKDILDGYVKFESKKSARKSINESINFYKALDALEDGETLYANVGKEQIEIGTDKELGGYYIRGNNWYDNYMSAEKLLMDLNDQGATFKLKESKKFARKSIMENHRMRRTYF